MTTHYSPTKNIFPIIKDTHSARHIVKNTHAPAAAATDAAAIIVSTLTDGKINKINIQTILLKCLYTSMWVNILVLNLKPAKKFS
jgi:hypothetical protein